MSFRTIGQSEESVSLKELRIKNGNTNPKINETGKKNIFTICRQFTIMLSISFNPKTMKYFLKYDLFRKKTDFNCFITICLYGNLIVEEWEFIIKANLSLY